MASRFCHPAPGLSLLVHPPDSDENENLSDLKDRMPMWLDRERAVFGDPEQSQENARYSACRGSLLPWLGYILLKYDALRLKPKAVTLLDAFAAKSSWPSTLPSGSIWAKTSNLGSLPDMGQQIPATSVLTTLVAVAWLTMKTDSTMNAHDLSQKMLGTAVITGIMDLAGNCEKTTPVLKMLGMIEQEEIMVLARVGGRTCLTTPHEWAHAVMVQLGAHTSPSFAAMIKSAMPHVDQWATHLMGAVSASPNFPPRSLGITACALGLVHADVMQPHSCWHLNFLQMVGQWSNNASIHLEFLAQSAHYSVNAMRLMVLDVTTAYLTATLTSPPAGGMGKPPGVEPTQLQQALQDQLSRIRLGSGSSSTTIASDDSAAVYTGEDTSPTQVMATASAEILGASTESQQLDVNRNSTLLVSHFPRAALPEDLREVFCELGVTGAQVVLDRNGVSRCYGFVRFSDHASAQRAMDACSCQAITLNDAVGEAWTLRADWANKSIPEVFEQTPVAQSTQTGKSGGGDRRKKRVPPTGLNRND